MPKAREKQGPGAPEIAPQSKQKSYLGKVDGVSYWQNIEYRRKETEAAHRPSEGKIHPYVCLIRIYVPRRRRGGGRPCRLTVVIFVDDVDAGRTVDRNEMEAAYSLFSAVLLSSYFVRNYIWS